MSVKWHVADAVKEDELNDFIGSLDACFALKGKQLTKDPKSVVSLHSADKKIFYVKRYTSSGKYLRKYIGRSRVKAEWENLQLFKKLGIPTLDILANGEEYRRGKFFRGALVTAAINDANDLEKLAKHKSPLLFNRDSFRHLARQVACYTKIMHDNKFSHNDLDWRNILVAPSSENIDMSQANVYFFDSPGGRHWMWPFLEYRIIKDLAHLDKIARDCLPLRWRLWFYHQYTGRKHLTKNDKRRLQKIFLYYKNR